MRQEAAVGLAADVGTLVRLPKKTGNSSLLHELAFTARNFSADEAKELGLISRVRFTTCVAPVPLKSLY